MMGLAGGVVNDPTITVPTATTTAIIAPTRTRVAMLRATNIIPPGSVAYRG